ncbi:MAG: response regulator transcription factor [Bacteroidetes bacterium]|nr:response regulator transcription factor [Bacteroidota bacterium]
MNKLLFVEDDPDIVALLEHHFREAGYQVDSSSTGNEALLKASEQSFSLIVLDVMLPDMDGFAICRKLREKAIHTPVLMLTSRTDEFDKVLALELGADDYVTKPFSIRELVARVKALLRRSAQAPAAPPEKEQELVIRDLRINRNNRKVTLRGERLELTAKELELLYLLASNPGKTFSRFELLESVWGVSFAGYEHTVTSHINRLRLKIEPDINEPTYILTTWGTGYRFCE